MTKQTLDIGGMHCGACAAGIQMLLSSTDGIANITVDYEAKKGQVEYDETKITMPQIQDAVKELGYTAAPAK